MDQSTIIAGLLHDVVEDTVVTLTDIEADLTAIRAGLKSPQQVAAKLGMDYEDLLTEISQAKTMRERMGLDFPELTSSNPGATQGAAPSSAA